MVKRKFELSESGPLLIRIAFPGEFPSPSSGLNFSLISGKFSTCSKTICPIPLLFYQSIAQWIWAIKKIQKKNGYPTCLCSHLDACLPLCVPLQTEGSPPRVFCFDVWLFNVDSLTALLTCRTTYALHVFDNFFAAHYVNLLGWSPFTDLTTSSLLRLVHMLCLRLAELCWMQTV